MRCFVFAESGQAPIQFDPHWVLVGGPRNRQEIYGKVVDESIGYSHRCFHYHLNWLHQDKLYCTNIHH